MAAFVLTDSPDVDWNSIWKDLPKFNYRHRSTAGQALAQEEFDRRKTSGQPTVMWRFDHAEDKGKVVGRCHI